MSRKGKYCFKSGTADVSILISVKNLPGSKTIPKSRYKALEITEIRTHPPLI